MAPAALDTYLQHMKDLKRDGTYYDLILTGDLSNYGKNDYERFIKSKKIKNIMNMMIVDVFYMMLPKMFIKVEVTGL